MPLKIVRNDITKMNTEAIVNTANEYPIVGAGCDTAVYNAAGLHELLAYRQENIGYVEVGEAFITPGFNLSAKYIIHAVSPVFVDGKKGEEKKLRSCYRKSLALAKKNNISSISFPLIATGSYGYPKEEGMRIAVDEINAFLLKNQMDVTLVVFGDHATKLGEHIYPELEEYIDQNYVREKSDEEYGVFGAAYSESRPIDSGLFDDAFAERLVKERRYECREASMRRAEPCAAVMSLDDAPAKNSIEDDELFELEEKLRERIAHASDTFSEYLLFLIEKKGLKNSDVYNAAIVDKKVFSKIKNNPKYHPQKITALCLCVGAQLSLDETKDLLARAGYALSPCDITDIIFSFYIENEHYDMIDIDIQLEEHGVSCIIT